MNFHNLIYILNNNKVIAFLLRLIYIFQLPATPACARYFGDLINEERNGIAERKNFSPSSRRTLQYTFLSPASPGYIPITPGKAMSPRQRKTPRQLPRSPHQSLCPPVSPHQNMDTVPPATLGYIPTTPGKAMSPRQPKMPLPMLRSPHQCLGPPVSPHQNMETALPTTATSIMSAQLSTSHYSGNSEALFFKYALRPGIHTSTPIFQKSQTTSASPLLPFLSPSFLQTSLSPGPATLSPQSGFLPQPYVHIPTPVQRVGRSSSSAMAANTCNEPLDLSMPSRRTRSLAEDVAPIVIRPLDDCDDMMPSSISIKSESSGSITVSIQSLQACDGVSVANSISDTERKSPPSAEEDRESAPCTPPPVYRPVCSPVTPVRYFSPMEVSAYPDPTSNTNTPPPPSYSSTMTPRARQILQKWYMWNSPTSVPSQEVLEALSQRTGMCPTVITCWINSQRAAVNSSSSSGESSVSLPTAASPSVSRKRRASSSPGSPTAPAAKRPFRQKIPVNAESTNRFTTQGMFRPNYQPSFGYRPDEIINFLYFIPSPCAYHLHDNARVILENWYSTYRSPFVSFSTLQYLAYQTLSPIEAVMQWISHTVKMDTYRRFFST